MGWFSYRPIPSISSAVEGRFGTRTRSAWPLAATTSRAAEAIAKLAGRHLGPGAGRHHHRKTAPGADLQHPAFRPDRTLQGRFMGIVTQPVTRDQEMPAMAPVAETLGRP